LELVSGTLTNNLSNFTSGSTHMSNYLPASSTPKSGLNRMLPCSPCRKYRTRCQKTRNGPNGPCDACCDREGKAMGIPQSRRKKCLYCIKHRSNCIFSSAITEEVVEQNLQLQRGRGVTNFPVYSKEWFFIKLRSEQEQILQNLIDSSDRYLTSGVARPGGPCTRCLSLGLKCMVIKPGSIASTLSPNTKRCSNCLGRIGARIAGPWKVIRQCCSAKESQLLRMATNNTSGSDLQSFESSHSIQTTKIPLKDADDGNNHQLSSKVGSTLYIPCTKGSS